MIKLTRRQEKLLKVVREQPQCFVARVNEQPTLQVLVMHELVEQIGPKRYVATEAGRNWSPPESEPNPLAHYSKSYQWELRRRQKKERFWETFENNKSDE